MNIRVRVSTNKVGSSCYNEIEIDDEDLKGLSEEEKELKIGNQVLDYISENMIDWSWEEIEE